MFIIKKLLKAIISLLALFFTLPALSQQNQIATWGGINAEYFLKNKWSLWTEAQLKSQKEPVYHNYLELKGGFTFKYKKDIAFLMGMGQFMTYTVGSYKIPVKSHEFRLWEQVTLSNNISRLKIEHRYRLEQRWINNQFKNRLRYRLNPVIPINNSTLSKGTLYISIYDELFLTDKAAYFERNRLFAGLGFMVSKTFTFQAGLMKQFDYSSDNRTNRKNYLQAILLFRFNHSEADHPAHPASMD